MSTTPDTLDPTDVALGVARRALGEADLERRALISVRHLIAREAATNGTTPFLVQLASAVSGVTPATDGELAYEDLMEKYLTLLAAQR